jgi:hypothetical protein
MGSLGNLGTVKAAVNDTFGWFGSEISVNPALSDLVLMDFAEEASRLDENSPEALTFMKRQMRLVIAPSDFDEFWRLAVDNRQDSVDLMTVMKAIIGNATKRPTVLPSGSSDGQERIVVTFPDASSSPAIAGSPLTEADRRSIESMPGRPDLALVVDRAARERAAI